MDDAALTAWLDDRVASGMFRGTVLVWRAAAPAYAYAGGLASRAHGLPVTARTRFGVASVTKLVTAATALKLVDRGLLDLQAPLLDVLPPEHRTAAMTRAHTLHHLLSHGSGLPSYFDDDDPTWDSFLASWDRVPIGRARWPADLLPLFADLPAVEPPGMAYRYNDAGFVLAGLAIEAVTGRPWSDVATEEVLRPAGMADTAIEALDGDPPRLATGYLTDDGPPEAWRTNIFALTAMGMPDGGMISTGPDLARLLDALLDGRLLSAEMTAAMTSPQDPGTGVERYGYGCHVVVDVGRVAIVGHSGSDPGIAAEVWHHLAAGTTIAVLCNQDRGARAALLRTTEALGLHDPRA